MLKVYTIENKYLRVSFLNYGGAITEIVYKKQSEKNLVVAFDDIESYVLFSEPYLNVLVGPSAGRIGVGKYTLNDKEYQLSTNDGDNHLHGGYSGISKKYFDVKTSYNQAKLTLKTNHDVDGYIGNFNYEVIYRLEKNNLIIKLSCIPSVKTPLNMTSHLYFNLNGNLNKNITNHNLKIDSNKRVKLNKSGAPYVVEDIMLDTIFDFSKSKELDVVLKSKDKDITSRLGLDTPFILDGGVRLFTEDIKLEIFSSSESVIIYSANHFSKELVLSDKVLGYPYCGVAIENQDIPNSVNIFKNKNFYDADKPFIQTTIYKFNKI